MEKVPKLRLCETEYSLPACHSCCKCLLLKLAQHKFGHVILLMGSSNAQFHSATCLHPPALFLVILCWSEHHSRLAFRDVGCGFLCTICLYFMSFFYALSILSTLTSMQVSSSVIPSPRTREVDGQHGFATNNLLIEHLEDPDLFTVYGWVRHIFVHR